LSIAIVLTPGGSGEIYIKRNKFTAVTRYSKPVISKVIDSQSVVLSPMVVGRESSGGTINCLRINVLILWKCEYSNRVTKVN